MSQSTGNVLEKAYQNLQEFGYSWASIGLNKGKTVLENGAQKLKLGADYLSNLSEKLTVNKNGTVEEPATTEEPVETN